MSSPSDMNATNVAELAAEQASHQKQPDPHLTDLALKPAFFDWLCRMGDTTLILGHRVSEWCGHGPALEEDIAQANVALDLIGHTQMWLGLAAEVEDAGRTADNLAYLRDAMRFRNLLLVELPKGDMAVTIMRQFLFDAWHHGYLGQLTRSSSPRVAEIAAKALKEVTYHLERSSDLVVRLGDGTEVSHAKMQKALELLWPYTGEMFLTDEVDRTVAAAGIAPAAEEMHDQWLQIVSDILQEATLSLPKGTAFAQKGGRTGRHTEHLGFILAEMQFLQRAYPGASW